jgi:CubicO group peptidase (beta-lactamase class C family)
MRKLQYILLFLLATSLNAQQVLPKQALDSVVAKLVSKYNIPNVSIAFTNKQQVIYTISTPKTGIDTLFLIGSNTKSFTALAIMQLVDSGYVDLDKPVSHYIKDFSFANETAGKKITVRHLLNQTSGMPKSGGFYENDTKDFATYQKLYTNYLKTLPSTQPIGEVFQYSNANYVLLGLIVQQVTGKTFPAYVQEYIFKPLNMHHSYANYDSMMIHGLIDGYQYAYLLPVKSPTRPFSNFVVSEGHMASTANDMCAYLRAMMPDTMVKEKPDTIVKALGLHTNLYQQLITPNKDNYAMGWGETHYFGQKVIQHLGLNENYNAAMFMMPKQQLGVIILANTNSMEFSAEVKEAIVLTLLEKPYTDHLSIEMVQKAVTGVLVIWTFVCFLYQLNGWRLKGFKIGKPRFWTFLRFVFGVGLSLIPVLYVPKIGEIPLEAMAHHQPDYAYGFIGIAIFGVLASLLRVFKKSTPPKI